MGELRLFNSPLSPAVLQTTFDNSVAGLAVEAGAIGVCDIGQAGARLQQLLATCCDDEDEVCPDNRASIK